MIRICELCAERRLGMLDFLRNMGLRPRCPECGHRPLKRVRREGPVPCGRNLEYVYKCPKCGATVDLPPHLMMRLCE